MDLIKEDMSLIAMKRGQIIFFALILVIIIGIAVFYFVNKVEKNIEKEGERRYVNRNAEECTKLLFTCDGDETPFFNDNGCGCEPKKDGSEIKRNYCPEESREIDACVEIYQPVCGWFDSEETKCAKYPCAETFSNSCFSCQNSDVLYYTDGECPKQ